jgi:hypothetical protein
MAPDAPPCVNLSLIVDSNDLMTTDYIYSNDCKYGIISNCYIEDSTL